ncbi:hypothetical protein MWU57_08155 [Isoptericola sp. S6320L]|uniref:hypothetical protein n=1 Tax=Isoptericola sp. S6320L TaxID=2926411 RepID=UPI001FF190AC|nr:hypothetical protein [Isoptericola sp. S6320L]MCK0117007.1 hypothetical protein [Isoptericola sp. S6320L]
MSKRRRWTITADVVLAVCGPVWLFSKGADEPPGAVVAVVAAWVFLTVGAPWAVVRIVQLHRRWRENGRPFAQAPRTLVLTVCLAAALVLAGMTIGGPVGRTVVNLAGLALLAFGVFAFLAAFTPLGGVLMARSEARRPGLRFGRSSMSCGTPEPFPDLPRRPWLQEQPHE